MSLAIRLSCGVNTSAQLHPSFLPLKQLQRCIFATSLVEILPSDQLSIVALVLLSLRAVQQFRFSFWSGSIMDSYIAPNQ